MVPIEFEKYSNDHPNIHFIFVDDGSSDKTGLVLENLCKGKTQMQSITLQSNVGKAEAIREAILFMKQHIVEYDFVGYFDADLSSPLTEIQGIAKELIQRPERIMSMGVRVARMGARIRRNAVRHYLGRIFATIVSILLGMPVYDSQCGAKLIRSDITVDLFDEKFISRWFFDVELLFRLKNKYGAQISKDIIEHPLQVWNKKSGSKLKLRNYLLAPLDLLRIWWKYR